MKKHFLLTVISLFAITAFAAVGPQSVKVTFNDGMTTGWAVSNSGSMNAADGLLNVTMGVQKAEDNKYRADIDHKTPGTFTFDKTKDVIWAIKLSAAFVGNLSFEFEYVNSESGNTYISQSNITSTLSCADGGTIYYTDFSSKYDAVQDGTVTINVIRFKMADAVFADAADAHYSVDWIASFASLNDLKSFQEWTDEAQEANASLPYLELCFRPKSDASGYEDRKNGFSDVEFEGNYYAGLFAVEYFMIENFSAEKYYSLVLTTTGNNSALSIWDFPYQVNYEETASDIITKATAVVGIAPRATTGDINEPIASANIAGGAWTFIVPGNKLTVLATQGTKSLVGLLVSSKAAKTADQKGKFASCAHTSKAHPSLTIVPIYNATKGQMESSLAEAVTNANANDVIVLSDDATISDNRLEITKALTIQGATGSEKIICDVPTNSIMILANGNTENYTVTLKDLIADGQNTERSTQLFDINNKAKICFDGVRVINSKYSTVTGDVKCSGNSAILVNENSFPVGIYLNKGRRVEHTGATHTTPIRLILAGDFEEDKAVALTCSDPSLYEAIDAADATGWAIYESNNELKVKKVIHYTLNISPVAKMATMVIGFDSELPHGVKAYKLEYNESEYAGEVCAYDLDRIEKNKPVLIIADAGSYVFNGEVGATLDEQADPEYGALKGVYASGTVPACAAGVYNYILTSGNDGVGFYQVADASNAIGAHRAYLSCSYNNQGGSSAPRRMILNFDAHKTPTAIENIETSDKAEKLLIDGQIYIRKADHLYRVDGQLVK